MAERRVRAPAGAGRSSAHRRRGRGRRRGTRPTRPRIPASTTTDPPDLAAGHPGRPQDADLADALEDVHRQRVDDAERGDDDGDDRERVEQPEDPAERVVDGALDPVERRRLEGEVRGQRRRARRGAAAASRPARSGPRSASAPVTPSDSVASFQPTRIDSPPRPGHRPLDDAGDPQRRAPARRRSRTVSVWPTARPSRGRPGRPGRSSRRRRRAPARAVVPVARRRTAAGRRRARSAPTTAAASVRIAVEGDVERGDRADPGDAVDRARRSRRRSPRRARPAGSRSASCVARDHVGDPGARRRPGVLADPAERDDHRRGRSVSAPTVSAVRLGSRTTDARARRSSRRRTSANGRPATRASRAQDERRRAARRRAAGRVDGERARRAPTPTGVARPDEQPDDADRDEHADEPAQPGAPGRRQVEPGLERLDRRDPPGPAGRLERGRDRDAEADRGTRRRAAVERDRRALERDRADRPDVAGHQPRRAPAPSREADERRRRRRATAAWASTNRVTWPRVAPAARSRPDARGPARRRSSTAC